MGTGAPHASNDASSSLRSEPGSRGALTRALRSAGFLYVYGKGQQAPAVHAGGAYLGVIAPHERIAMTVDGEALIALALRARATR
jgi:hypothetical protein